jgi:hypothetical protein
MFRLINIYTSFASEKTASKIIYKLIDEYNKTNKPSVIFESKCSSPKNMNEVVKYFGKSLEQAFEENGFSYQQYQQLSDVQKNQIRNEIAQHFLTNYKADELIAKYQYINDEGYVLPGYTTYSLFPGLIKGNKPEDIHGFFTNEIKDATKQVLAKYAYLIKIFLLNTASKDKKSLPGNLPNEMKETIRHTFFNVIRKNLDLPLQTNHKQFAFK